MEKTLKESDLAMFIGSENYYRHALIRRIVYTDGIKHMAEAGGAYWLIDKVATLQMLAEIGAEEFQVWTLTVDPEEKTALLECDDGNGNSVYSEVIDYTDFPLPEIKIYFSDNVILLPSEY